MKKKKENACFNFLNYEKTMLTEKISLLIKLNYLYCSVGLKIRQNWVPCSPENTQKYL